MNKERLELVTMTRDVVVAFGEDSVSRRMARVIESSLDGLIASEQRAVIQMENYKDNATTARNYDLAVEALANLEESLEHALDEDWDQVAKALSDICDPIEDVE